MLWAGGIRCIAVGTGQREIGDEDRQDGVWGVAYRPRPTRDRLLSVKTDTTNSKLEHDIWRKNCLLHWISVECGTRLHISLNGACYALTCGVEDISVPI
jgi:hypothetical protein